MLATRRETARPQIALCTFPGPDTNSRSLALSLDSGPGRDPSQRSTNNAHTRTVASGALQWRCNVGRRAAARPRRSSSSSAVLLDVDTLPEPYSPRRWAAAHHEPPDSACGLAVQEGVRSIVLP